MKRYIRIENLNGDPYSMIFLDGHDYEYCEYAYEVAEALTELISFLQERNNDFYIECVNVENFSESKDSIAEVLEEDSDEITYIDKFKNL